ncbi:MAG: alpha/beta fold hydrolase [Planctomycetota bacterium]
MRIRTHDRVIAFEDSGGSGIPLLLVHGFPLDRSIWSAQVRELGDVARVIAPDLRGFGESPWTPDSHAAAAPPARPPAMALDDYAQDLALLLDALKIQSVVLGGVSMGGYIALAFQRLFPERLRGLLLIDTRSGPDSAAARQARDDAVALVRSQGAPAVAAQMLDKMLTPATLQKDVTLRRALLNLMSAQPVEGVVAALVALRDRPDAGPSLANIAVPVLVISGAADTLIPPSESEALTAAIPGARLALIPAAGHLPNYEQPAAFNQLVREFLGTLE